MIGMTETAGLDRIRARSFGAAAADYDKYRPRYPDQLVDDVVAVLPGRHVLEVGAGTGIATAAFAARGMAMTCIEPDAEMAAMLSAKFAADADLHVNVATFEEWAAARPAGAPGFDGLISAQAWHWTDPNTRWADADAAVRSGGMIALFWNEDHHADPRVLDAFTAAYDRRGIEIRLVRTETALSSDPTRSSTRDIWTDGPRVTRKRRNTSRTCVGTSTTGRTGCRWAITWRASTPRRRT